MSSKWKLTATLAGANNKEVTKTWDLGEFTDASFGAEAALAVSAADQVIGSFVDVSEANIHAISLAAYEESTTLNAYVTAGAGGGDSFTSALVNCYLQTEPDKVTQVYIPAPVIGIFQGATGVQRDRVDITDADLTQYVQQLAQHTFVSDNEQIDTTQGDDGMKDGRRVVRRHKLG